MLQIIETCSRRLHPNTWICVVWHGDTTRKYTRVKGQAWLDFISLDQTKETNFFSYSWRDWQCQYFHCFILLSWRNEMAWRWAMDGLGRGSGRVGGRAWRGGCLRIFICTKVDLYLLMWRLGFLSQRKGWLVECVIKRSVLRAFI